MMRWLEFSFIPPSNLVVHRKCWSKEGKIRGCEEVFGLFGIQQFKLFSKLGIMLLSEMR